MPDRQEIFNQVLADLFKLADKAKGKYDEILDKFNIKNLDQIQDFDVAKLKKILDNVALSLKIGNKKMGKIYTSKDFDSELDGLFLKNAVKLAQEKEEEQSKPAEPPKQEEQSKPTELPKEEPKQEEQKSEETQEEGEESQKIEDVVKDLQIGIMEKVNEVKSFKPGRSEAINFRNAVQELIKAGEDAVQKINSYYQKELGGSQEQTKTSASRKVTNDVDVDREIRKIKGTLDSAASEFKTGTGTGFVIGILKDAMKGIQNLIKGMR